MLATSRTAADLKPLESKHANLANASFPPESTLLPLPAFAKTGQRPAKSKPSKYLFKSQSTPHLRARNIMSESELQAKRNKLGYQRISIACAHCRRRKIRCLMSENEGEGRCANCIRLKKECVFYPVDQQAAIDAQAESSAGGRTNNGSRASSAASISPPLGATRPFDHQHQTNGSTYSVSSADDRSVYIGIPIAPSHSQPPLGSMSAPIPQQSQFEQSHREFTSAQYGFAPSGDMSSLDHHAPNFSRPILTTDAHLAFASQPPISNASSYSISSPVDAPQYTYSPISPYDHSSQTPQHAQWPLQQPPVVRSMSYTGPVPSYSQQQPSSIYQPAFTQPEQRQPPVIQAPQQHDPRMVQYTNYHATPPSAAQHQAHAYMQPWPPQYHQHYQAVQPLQSNWFGETTGRSSRHS
ncbi:uncharacterized protein MYCGRDRAFT_93114 [Zymoseptoria tritici IPO323]|uniref:Zn(2)-C6 fungal-type domain-containing protein n=1 Tax=Zymoseptoria tritici (strain CBS 115943 / IPO323) TaxID=336722 RepID=F9XBL0_ZYMTI|nr:uncharacterized protein MYCGRDRAFT_93114 [Zymoseptoria tritici IPO323]EGP87671.1 hypothetical protein MYCGRDRAFT_93114 [Zymoseptoria tritici IPO323]